MTDIFLGPGLRTLVPGHPESIEALASRLATHADGAGQAAMRLRQIDAGAWAGEAAEAFREAIGKIPDRLVTGAQSFSDMAAALRVYAAELREAQANAGRAMAAHTEAVDEAKRNAALGGDPAVAGEAGRTAALAGDRPAAAAETRSGALDAGGQGPADRAAAASRLLDEARADVEAAARKAAARLDQAASVAPSRPSLLSRAVHGLAEFGGGMWESAADLVTFGFKLSPAYFLMDREAYAENLHRVGTGLATMATHPKEFAKAVVDWDTWAESPGRALGHLVPKIVVAFMTSGGGLAARGGTVALRFEGVAARAGSVATKLDAVGGRLGEGIASRLETLGVRGGSAPGALGEAATAARTGLRDAMERPRLFARESKCRFLGRDPVDVATGEMIMQQAPDVELPGAPPLVIQRTHRSFYRAGRWFGPTWSSTLDHRLEIDEAGVCYAADDGLLLAYPMPRAGRSVLPAEGPRLPLTRVAWGYLVEDPASGRTLHFADRAGAGGEPATEIPLAAITDRNGHRIELDYGDDGLLLALRHSGGYHVDVETWRGLVTELRLRMPDGEPAHVLVRYTYDDDRRLVGVVNSSGLPLRFAYDEGARMLRWEDRNGAWYRYAYDELGRCVRTSGSGGCLDGTIAYREGVTVETNSLGHATAYHVNDRLQVERVVDPLGGVTVHEWDAYDRKLATSDPLGRITRYAYDEAGNVVGITRPDGRKTTVAHNDLRLPVTITDPAGGVWQRRYDERGNLLAVTDPLGATTTYAYDDRGHLSRVTDALGHIRQIESDPAGLPVAVTDALGATTRYERDPLGRVVSITDAAGGVTRLRWTLEGTLASRTLPDGATERWSYDGEGNVVEHVDALGQVTTTEIVAFDLPGAQTGPDGARMAFSYDTELRLVGVTNPQGLEWRYDYDAAGNLVRETDFNGRVLTYALDAAGQLVERTNGMGETTRLVRDRLGNVVEQRSGDAVTTFSYDALGQVTVAANADCELRFERDPLGRVRSETCNGRSVTSCYDALGRRTRRETPSGAVSTWAYGPGDRPRALHAGGRTMQFSYDALGREIERRFGDGVAIAQTWDASHRLRSQAVTASRPAGATPAGTTRAGATPAGTRGGATPAGAPGGDSSRYPGGTTPAGARQERLLQRRSYTYRADGYLTAVDDLLNGPRRIDLDPAGRITAVEGAAWIERYAYDAAGNLTDATWPEPASPDTLDAQGERQYDGTLIRRAGNVRYEHDSQGRVTLRQEQRPSAKPRTWRYTWDANDHLRTVLTPDGQRWRYRYDPLGRRIAKQRLAPDCSTLVEEVTFAWDGLLLAEQTRVSTQNSGTRRSVSPNTTTWDWEPGAFRVISQTQRASPRRAPHEGVDEELYAIATDLIGTPSELVSLEGDIAWQRRTSGWGASVSRGLSLVECPLRFPGQYFDQESETHYNFFRHYDPSAARYLSNDPIGLALAPDAHAYVANPFHWIDPLGWGPGVPSASGRATSAADMARLTRQLQFEEASSIFTGSGLKPSIISNSRPIIPGQDLANPLVTKALTSTGDDIADWAKYTTQTVQSPSGPFQVHFYMNSKTSVVDYTYDYKAVFSRPR